MRDDDGGRDCRPRDAGYDDRSACCPPPPRERVPDAEARNDERDLLLAGRSGNRAERERKEAVLVEKPERVQQQRRRKRNRMELVQRQPARGRVEQVRKRKADADA